MKKENKTVLMAYEEPRLTELLVAVEQGFSNSDYSQIDPGEGGEDFGEF